MTPYKSAEQWAEWAWPLLLAYTLDREKECKGTIINALKAYAYGEAKGLEEAADRIVSQDDHSWEALYELRQALKTYRERNGGR